MQPPTYRRTRLPTRHTLTDARIRGILPLIDALRGSVPMRFEQSKHSEAFTLIDSITSIALNTTISDEEVNEKINMIIRQLEILKNVGPSLTRPIQELLSDVSNRPQNQLRPHARYSDGSWVNYHTFAFTSTTATQSITITNLNLGRMSGTSNDSIKIESRDTKVLKKKNTPDKRSWLRFPIGIEYTFFKTKLEDEDDDWSSKSLEDIAIKFRKLLPDNHIVYVDRGPVLEVGSPVHRSIKHIKEWYRFLRDKAHEHELTSWSPKKGGGGGHINVSLPLDKVFATKFLCNMFTDLSDRPYLNWIFNDPSDNHTAQCLWNGSFLSFYDQNFDDPTVFEAEDVYDRIKEVFTVDDKGFAAAVKNSYHFELRIFDMVRNERDLVDHIKFVNAYLLMIEKETKAGIKIKRNPRINKMARRKGRFNDFRDPNYVELADGAVSEFKALLVKIGLNYRDYRRFVERNFYRRRRVYGKKYFT